MKTLLKISSYVSFISQAFAAISEGFNVTVNKWPSDNPFTNGVQKEKSVSNDKTQG